MKEILKKLIYRFGYSVTRLDSRVEVDCAWGPNILLYALEDLAQFSPTSLKIVQIGAHDGSDQDPVQPFLTRRDCDAILIEPMDAPYKALADRYKSNKKIHTLQAAIGEKTGSQPFYYIEDENGLPDLTLLSSFDYGTIQRNLQSRISLDKSYRRHLIRTKEVQVRDLKSVLQEFNMESVDAIIVDVEGFDDKIVRNFLSDGIEPKIIRFEYCNLSRRNFYEIRDLLLSRGYEIARVGIDIYCQKAGILR